MSTNQQNKEEEEVDLGSLFSIIGKGFSKVFNFIGDLFKGIFHVMILFLMFIKKHLIKFAIAAVIGGAIGSYFQMDKATIYASDLTLKPNFESSRQLYTNISYYDVLVKEKDSATLGRIFNISPKEASAIKAFKVSAVKTNNDIIESYHDLIKALDTIGSKNFTFEEFKKGFTSYDYKVHTVHVRSKDKNVFSKLGEVIISSITENEYYENLRKLTRENLYRRDSLLRENLNQTDTLRRVYMEVMLKEADKPASGTSIDLGGQNTRTKELDLFQTNRIITRDLENVYEDISEKSEIVNVISEFQPKGYKIGGIRNNSIVLFALLGVVLMMFVILLIGLNKFLENYKK